MMQLLPLRLKKTEREIIKWVQGVAVMGGYRQVRNRDKAAEVANTGKASKRAASMREMI